MRAYFVAVIVVLALAALVVIDPYSPFGLGGGCIAGIGGALVPTQ